MKHTHEFVDGAGNSWLKDGLTDDQAVAIAKRDHLMVERLEGDDLNDGESLEGVEQLGCFISAGVIAQHAGPRR